MSYSFGDTKPGLLATTSPAPGSVTDPTQCPAGTHFMPDTREAGSPGTCMANSAMPNAIGPWWTHPQASLAKFWNASTINKAIVIAPIVLACMALGYLRPGNAAEHGTATPIRRRRRMRRNHEARIYTAMEQRVRRASAADLRRMATWMSQGSGARDPQEKVLLARIRAELMRRGGIKLPRQMPAAMTANAKLSGAHGMVLRDLSERPAVVSRIVGFHRDLVDSGYVTATNRDRRWKLSVSASGRSALRMKSNRRFRRNGYRVVGAGGVKVPQVFGAHHQAVQYGDRAFGPRNYVVEFVFNANPSLSGEQKYLLSKMFNYRVGATEQLTDQQLRFALGFLQDKGKSAKGATSAEMLLADRLRAEKAQRTEHYRSAAHPNFGRTLPRASMREHARWTEMDEEARLARMEREWREHGNEPARRRREAGQASGRRQSLTANARRGSRATISYLLHGQKIVASGPTETVVKAAHRLYSVPGVTGIQVREQGKRYGRNRRRRAA